MRIAVVDAAATRPLRQAVLRPTWTVDQPMHGDQYADAVHFGAYDGDRLVCTCLVLPRPYPGRPNAASAWQLRGMATADGRRGEGIGARVLAAAIEEITRRGATLIWCEARVTAVAFYAQHGFTVDGPEYAHAESGTPHHYMWRDLSPA